MHKNFFIFQADSYFDLGFAMGKKFFKEAHGAIKGAKDKTWTDKLDIAKKMLAVTQKYFPQYVEELKGYAKGADVDFLDFWAISLETDIDVDNDSARCTNIITNGGKLIGHNEDAMGPGLENTVCIVKKILPHITTFEIYYYNLPSGPSVSVNSHGYACALNTLLGTKTRMGIPKNIIARYLLETRNPDKDIAYVLRLPRASGYNHNIVYKSGKIWNAEITADGGMVTTPSSPFVHSNHCLRIKSDVNDDYGTITRLEFARKQVKENMSVDDLINLQNDSSSGQEKSLMNERTIGKMVIDFEYMIAKLWLLREKELGWIDYPLDFVVRSAI